ncbi:hypothetical protein DKX38_023027 [Salix brachista]|uniref:Uncharacterized protein n=1 Tax=Salix brachista TaxID=2182728 RepID=A0A5N5K1A3_9ROSI|nr:hypothetical protein DKX38_023027 [Salix brachista]
MVSISISDSLHRACCSHRVTKKQRPQAGPGRSLGSKQMTHVVTLNVEGRRGVGMSEQQEKPALATGHVVTLNVEGQRGLDMLGQAGNFICKAVLFETIIGIILFRLTEDFENLRKLVDEATFYEKL